MLYIIVQTAPCKNANLFNSANKNTAVINYLSRNEQYNLFVVKAYPPVFDTCKCVEIFAPKSDSVSAPVTVLSREVRGTRQPIHPTASDRGVRYLSLRRDLVAGGRLYFAPKKFGQVGRNENFFFLNFFFNRAYFTLENRGNIHLCSPSTL